MNKQKPKRKKSRHSDAPSSTGKPLLTNPKKPGDPESASTPDFGQSVEAGGVD
jgi:hypothetical protein